MKKLLMSLLLVAPAAFAMNQKVTLPTAKTLKERLDNEGLTHFAEKTTILSLAGEEKKSSSCCHKR